MKNCSIFKGNFRQAAWIYIAIKLLMAVLVFSFLPCSTCESWQRYFFFTVLRVAILGHFLYMGFTITTKLLTITNTTRTFFYLIDFFVPKNLMIIVPFFSSPLTVSSVDGAGNYILFVNAILGGIISLALARAGWGLDLKRMLVNYKEGGDKMDKTLCEKGQNDPVLEVAWTDEAIKRIELAPPFVKKIVEKKAMSMGLDTITTELLEQLRTEHTM